MPEARTILLEMTINQLARTCGLATATIRKRLGDLKPSKQVGNGVYFHTREAMPKIFGQEGLDPQREKAKLDSERAKLAQLQVAERKGELVPALEVEETLVALASSTASRLLGIASKCAQELAAIDTPSGCQAVVEAAIVDALTDLTSASDEAARIIADRSIASRSGSRDDGDQRDAPASDDDDSRVGGSSQVRRGRNKRRAG